MLVKLVRFISLLFCISIYFEVESKTNNVLKLSCEFNPYSIKQKQKNVGFLEDEKIDRDQICNILGCEDTIEVNKYETKINDKYSKAIWNEILTQARQHPIHIRDVYEIILSKDDPYYIKRWMNYAGVKNLNSKMPNILRNKLLSNNTKNDILSYWKRISPKDFNKYSELD